MQMEDVHRQNGGAKFVFMSLLLSLNVNDARNHSVKINLIDTNRE